MGHGHGEELHDNGRVNVGRDAHREDGELPEGTPGEHVEKLQNTRVLDQPLHLLAVDAGHRDMEPDHEHGEHHEDELNALAQLRQRERGQQ